MRAIKNSLKGSLARVPAKLVQQAKCHAVCPPKTHLHPPQGVIHSTCAFSEMCELHLEERKINRVRWRPKEAVQEPAGKKATMLCPTPGTSAKLLNVQNSQLRSQALPCLHRVLAAAPGQARAQGTVLLGHHARALPAGAHVCQPRLRQAPPERSTICTCNPAHASHSELFTVVLCL